MTVAVLLGLGWFCAPLGALVLDFNNIKSSADVQGARKGSQCMSDRDCNTRKFCLKPEDEKPFCATCRGLRRRCQRNAMCCPGTLCINDVCSTMEDAIPILERQTDDQDGLDTKGTSEHPIQENKPKRKPSIKKSQSSKASPLSQCFSTFIAKARINLVIGQEGDSCLRSFDCGPGLCCARHFWTKMCKPVLLEGQVCSRRGHKDTAQAPEIFQRCDCGPGLLCRSQVSGNRQHARLRVCQKI
ncbi:Dickkopf-related protein 4 [Galemys pyrenaicus]|uniref:Dickkopf-related protein 4 n=1 Tax=Galemys pyrenaicus TaxID=202257 RepID=A0A8J6DN89_GALPY|nr:Dickkopf-related protein 4 [Galemys pyrenaicus]